MNLARPSAFCSAQVLLTIEAVEGRPAERAELARGDHHLAVLLDLAERRVPDERRVDVAALPGGGDLRRLQVEDLDLVRVDAEMLEREQQVEVRGRDERHADLLADQVLDLGDAGALARDQRLGRRDVLDDPDQLHVDALADAGGDRARARERDLDVARRHRGDHLGAAVELPVLDVPAGRPRRTCRRRSAPSRDCRSADSRP